MDGVVLGVEDQVLDAPPLNVVRVASEELPERHQGLVVAPLVVEDRSLARVCRVQLGIERRGATKALDRLRQIAGLRCPRALVVDLSRQRLGLVGLGEGVDQLLGALVVAEVAVNGVQQGQQIRVGSPDGESPLRRRRRFLQTPLAVVDRGQAEVRFAELGV